MPWTSGLKSSKLRQFVHKAFPIHNDLKHLAFRVENMSCTNALISTRNPCSTIDVAPVLDVLDPIGNPGLLYVAEQ